MVNLVVIDKPSKCLRLLINVNASDKYVCICAKLPTKTRWMASFFSSHERKVSRRTQSFTQFINWSEAMHQFIEDKLILMFVKMVLNGNFRVGLVTKARCSLHNCFLIGLVTGYTSAKIHRKLIDWNVRKLLVCPCGSELCLCIGT